MKNSEFIQQPGFLTLINNTNDLAIILSQQGQIFAANKAAMAFYGWRSHTLHQYNYFAWLEKRGLPPALTLQQLKHFTKPIKLRKTTITIKKTSYSIRWSVEPLGKQGKQALYLLLGKKLTVSTQTTPQSQHFNAYQLENLIAHLPGNIYWMDKDSIYLGCNDNVAKMFGLKSRHDIVGKTYEDFAKLVDWDQSQGNSFRKDDLEVIATGKAKLNVEEPPIKDIAGNVLHFLTSRVPIYDEKGKIAGVAGISIDISERKKMEEELRQAKELSEKFSLEKLTLIAEITKEIIGTPVKSCNSTEDYVNILRHHFESIIACMPGNVYWMDKNSVYLGCNENAAKMIGLNSPTEIIGKSYKDFAKLADWSQGQPDSFRKDDLEVIATGKPKLNVEEPPIKDADGNTLYFLTSRVPIRDEDGAVTGVVGISIDITERKKMEMALREAKEAAEAANRAKTEFLANMRHDIRTPLSGIVGFAQLIQLEADNPKIKEYTDYLVASSTELLDFLNEVLEMVRLSQGNAPLLKKQFDLQARLNNVIKLNLAKAATKKLALTLEYDPALPHYVLGDPVRLHRIVLELVTNALNFTAAGAVKVAARLASQQKRNLVVEISVTDTGIGIAEEKQSDIFMRFKRLTPSYEGIYKGAGLGLTIVKQFIDDLDGEIEVISAVNQGTTFICRLPLKTPLLSQKLEAEPNHAPAINAILPGSGAKPPQLSAATVNRATTNTNTKKSPLARVLLVEDQAIAATVAAGILTQLHCRVDIAPTGKAALKHTRKQAYDLIFMDIGLPDISGLDITQQLRLQNKLHANTPIVALTSHVGKESAQRCLNAGMNAVLNKPLTAEHAEETLLAFVPKYHQHKSAAKAGNGTTSATATQISTAPTATVALPDNVIDYTKLTSVFGNNEQTISEILQQARDILLIDQADFVKAYQNQDWPALRALAHRMKGGAAYYGAVRLQAACKTLEKFLASANTNAYNEPYQLTLDEITHVQQFISARHK